MNYTSGSGPRCSSESRRKALTLSSEIRADLETWGRMQVTPTEALPF